MLCLGSSALPGESRQSASIVLPGSHWDGLDCQQRVHIALEAVNSLPIFQHLACFASVSLFDCMLVVVATLELPR